MNADDPLLDRAAIEDALRHLGDRLVRRGVIADLYVAGRTAFRQYSNRTVGDIRSSGQLSHHPKSCKPRPSRSAR